MKRNIILLSITMMFILLMTLFWSFVLGDKYDEIVDLEDNQKIANEKYITTQILSDSLYYVYNMFEKNLAKGKNDELRTGASRLDRSYTIGNIITKKSSYVTTSFSDHHLHLLEVARTNQDHHPRMGSFENNHGTDRMVGPS